MMLPFFPRTGSHGAGLPGTNSAGASTPIGAYILHAGLYSNGVSRQALALLQVYNSPLAPMNTLEDIASLSREELLVLVAEQQRQIIQLHGQLAEATTTIKTLQVEVDRLKREQKRQAAPLSKGTRVRRPKPPGRKPGS